MRIEFESAVLTALPDAEKTRPAKEASSKISDGKVGWFIQALDVGAASIRYRCFHFARLLAPKFQSQYLTSLDEVREAITGLDALIVVKRIDRTVVELVALARQSGVPVFLDLCDDLLAPRYAKNEQGVNLLHFLGIIPFLEGVTVPSAEMAERLEGYALDHGYSGLSVHVIPDIAETWGVYRATLKAVTGTDLDKTLNQTPPEPGPHPKRIIWFGNYGASHSNFGMFSLKPYLKAIRTVHAEIPIELVIVSNSEAVYRALVQDCGFPTRYVPWSPSAIYSELATADVALLTTGDDDFCSIKSSNRLLQALSMDVPVIVPKNPFAEFDDIVFSGRIEESLRVCLDHRRNRVVVPRLKAARRLLKRYEPKRLTGIWAKLLKAAARRRQLGIHQDPRGSVLLLAEPGDNGKAFKSAVSAAKNQEGLDYELLISTDLLEGQPEFGAMLAKASAVPSFFSGKLKGGQNRLLGCSALVVDRPDAPIAKQLTGYAKRLGVPILTNSEAGKGALSRFAKAPARGQTKNSIRAGPYEEGENSDGTVDWAFIVHQNARGWILDAICREIGSRQPDSWKVSYFPEPAPEAKNYFFSHYLLLQNYLEKYPDKLNSSNVFVWYTHPREEDPAKVARLLLDFDHVSKVIFACDSNRQLWLGRGLPEDKAIVVLGAADPALFSFHERGEGVVGLSSSFYERKNPDCLLEVVKLLPHREFLLLGRKWNQYALFEEMKALPNFTYKSAPYSQYPSIYATFDVFLSMSSLEGGPIPLIEAMMSNAVPVASRTGFAPDLITEGENGFIFDLDAPANVIAEMIEAAFALPTNVRETVEDYDWDNFSSAIVKLADE